MAMTGPAPFIITAQLPPDIHSWATGLRREHFPPERNHLDAHVTLFHILPPSAETEIRDALAYCAKTYRKPEAQVEDIMSLGKGTAFKVFSHDMQVIRAELADRFHGLLTDQDAHTPRLHITIQNKVTLKEARALQAELQSTFIQRNFAFLGLSLHIYRGGPWEFVKSWSFRG
ncbi:2'-5' RNA ligase family protein [Altericroceibacterium indicum]|nr:2'-5' RNA ligase family protein [Altericroceibacterium indicum]